MRPDEQREAMLTAVLSNDIEAQSALISAALPPIVDMVADDKLVDAKIAASEARTDTKFAKLESKLDLLLERIEAVRAQSVDARSEARATRRTVVGTGISLGALLIAAFSFYVNAFNMGTKVDDVARVEAQQVYNQMEVRRQNDVAQSVAQQPVKALPPPAAK